MKVLILMYHMITRSDHPLEERYAVPKESFSRQMWYLRQAGYNPVSLDSLYDFLHGRGSLPKNPVAITFDDGFLDNYENALPVLQKYGYPSTVFVVSGLAGKTNVWDQKIGFSKRKLMGWSEIDEMHSCGVTIGSHTVSHHRLSLLDIEDAKREITESKRELEDRVGKVVTHFAYPYGDKNDSVIKAVREAGYSTACSTRAGFNRKDIGLYELRRIGVYGTDALWQFAVKLRYGTNDANSFFPLKYYMNRIVERFGRWT